MLITMATHWLLPQTVDQVVVGFTLLDTAPNLVVVILILYYLFH